METQHPTWAVSLIWKVSTVVVAVTHPWGQITQSSFLTALEGCSFHSQAEETGAISGFWKHWKVLLKTNFKEILTNPLSSFSHFSFLLSQLSPSIIFSQIIIVDVLTAVHFITSILTVDHLVTAAVVGDTASIFALELSHFAQGHCRMHSRFHKWGNKYTITSK